MKQTSKVGLEVTVSSHFKNRAAPWAHMLSTAHMWSSVMPCCWASTCPPARARTYSRHSQLMNHRVISCLWGHGMQPAARFLCSLSSKAKCLVLLSFKQLELNVPSISLSACSSILLEVCEISVLFLFFFLEIFLIYFSSYGNFISSLYMLAWGDLSKIKLLDILFVL